ncbi:MAG: WD40 repeat domain-containing protein [Planctomycetota bacterium]
MRLIDETAPPQTHDSPPPTVPPPTDKLPTDKLPTDKPPFVPGKVALDKTVRLPSITFCLARHEQSSRIFFGGADFGLHHFDPTIEKPEPKPLSESRHASYVTGLVNSAGTLISAGYDKALIWWNAETGEPIRRIEAAHERWIRSLAVSPDGNRLASVGDDMKTRLWDAASGTCLLTLDGYEPQTPHGFPSMLYTVVFSADGSRIATGNKTGRVLIRDANSGEIQQTIEAPVMYTWDPRARRHSIGGIRSLAFSPDGSLIAVGGMGQVGNIDHLEGKSRVEVFRVATRERVHEIEDSNYKGLVEKLQFSPDQKWLVAAGGDSGGFVSVWSMETGKLLAQEKVGSHLHDFEMLSDRQLITVGHEQATLISLAENSAQGA